MTAAADHPAEWTEEDLRSELFHMDTLMDAAHAEEKRHFWYMMLGGSPVVVITVFWGLLGYAGWAIGLAAILFSLWHMARWQVAARKSFTLEQRHEELTQFQQQGAARVELTHGVAEAEATSGTAV